MQIVVGVYDDAIPEQKQQLADFVRKGETLTPYSGVLTIEDGVIQDAVSVIHARSLAEDVLFYNASGDLMDAKIQVNGGKIADDKSVEVRGKSLLHSAPLTTEAFTRSPMGDYGSWVVTIGLLLFAFSTTLAWAYYGGRSIVYLFGTQYLIYYRLLYCVFFFVGAFVDTTIIWSASLITTAMMAVPNLVGIFLLRKDIKQTVGEYWEYFKKEFPDKKALH